MNVCVVSAPLPSLQQQHPPIHWGATLYPTWFLYSCGLRWRASHGQRRDTRLGWLTSLCWCPLGTGDLSRAPRRCLGVSPGALQERVPRQGPLSWGGRHGLWGGRLPLPGARPAACWLQVCSLPEFCPASQTFPWSLALCSLPWGRPGICRAG